MLVGLADTLIVSYAGEAAVSGVSLVNQFNTIFIFLFTALASGGAVVISQYTGRGERDNAGKAASQLLLFSTAFSAGITLLTLAGNRMILRALFGSVDADVMEACVIYLRISAYSFPALAVYNAGAAVFRSIGRTDITMVLSLFSNLINVGGNLLGVFVFHAGVAGVAWPSLIARMFSAVAVTVLCFKKSWAISYEASWLFHADRVMLKKILWIAIPNGVENGVFQLVKVALSGIAALFGTSQIAANGVAQSIWSLAALAGVAMGPAFITVIGQCMGRGDTGAAAYYLRKLSLVTLAVSAVWNLLILLITPFFLRVYALEAETKQLVFRLVLIHNAFNAAAFPFSGALSAGLRAAGDVRYTMAVSLASTIAGRLLLSWILGVSFGMGVIGIAIAMVIDWSARAVLFILRAHSGKWKEFDVI
ncbi:MAG: MATE family efflux transporter [Oscillibacter sp.]|nr:MATE family efflux transporter [Oscillibacter sp.]